MAQNISLLGAEYSAVPSVLLPKTGGGTASFTDVTDTTAAAADVAAGKYFYTASGVRTLGTGSGGGGTGGIYQDQDGYLVLSPDGGGGGGGGFTLLYSAEVQASTTSTSATSLETFETGVTFEEGKTYMVSVRDKAGKRNGYFYGTDSYFFIADANFSSNTTLASVCIGVDSNGAYNWATTARGVYLYRYYGGSNMGNINIYERYESTRGTVDGTYTVKLFEVTLPT